MFDKFERVSEPNERKRLQCNQCKRSTIHTLESRCVGSWAENHPIGGHIDGGTDFSLFRCGACDEVSFEKSSWCSEEWDHDEHGQVYFPRDEIQYPPPVSSNFSFNTDYTPAALNEILEEMLYALAGAKLNLGTIGLRLAVELIVKDRKCSGRNLKAKIDDLEKKELVDIDQRDLLHRIREKGNAGAHDGIAMRQSKMIAGMEIVDLLLEKVYNGPGRHADVMKKATKAFEPEGATTQPRVT